jgi:hypothetical protein
MIDVVQNYIRGDATRMETYIELGALVYEHKHCKGIFARSKLNLGAIRSMHADYYDLTDETCIDTSSNSSNQKIKALEKAQKEGAERQKELAREFKRNEEGEKKSREDPNFLIRENKHE